MLPPLLALLCLSAPSLLAGCTDGATCGDGTEQRTDPATGAPVCVATNTTVGVSCDVDGGGVRIVGGVCVTDPGQFPTCGAGTRLDVASNTCLPLPPPDGGTGPTVITPPPCPTQDSTHYCINGVVRYLRDGSYTKGKVFEVRAYNPLAFLGNPQTTPDQVVMTDSDGTYVMSGLTDTSGQHLAAVAVIDPGTTHDYVLCGAGQNATQYGMSYQVDLSAVEKTVVAGWDSAAQLAANTLESQGVYLVRFYDLPAAMESATSLTAGALVTYNGKAAPGQLFFKGDLATIDPAAVATDGATGSALVSPGALGLYSGMGGGVTKWESGLGGSAAGVVFIQKFHPGM